MIRVVLTDDQNLIRQGIKSLLALTKDIAVVGECQDGEETVAHLAEYQPDVLLLDVRMPQMNGLEVVEILAREARLPPTIILTTFDDDDVVLEAIQGGAKGYLLKDVSLEQLTDAIRIVAGGGRLIQPALTDRLMQRFQRRGAPAAARVLAKPLSPRELEVLRLICGGFSNAEIAQTLGAGEGTVKNHTSSILAKLGARDRTRAVLKALEWGLI